MPRTVPIPPWNAEGLLPPSDLANPVSVNRAPYPVTLTDVVLRFNTSAERAAILVGFLDYRAALHAAGLVMGFHWLNGSFVEHIEVGARRRQPNDVDVVTFYHLPATQTQATLLTKFPALFPSTAAERDALKTRYRVDGYTQALSASGERLVDRSAYWYGVWGHQRSTFKWKGFLQVDLAPGDDAVARALLSSPPSATPLAAAPASALSSLPPRSGGTP